ncbi:DUF6185 family protein [Streptomyces sp. Z26]|uniref:DUF6185 family protein n=1 Tax=Streptomyces sp. Z26 TaxID=2500177 RepID=UPI001F0C2D0D|nr:DUF6185 family protein [Streptomyces sp. Z26]
MLRRLRHVLFLWSAATLLCLLPAAPARAADDVCNTGQLKSVRATASVRFTHEDENYSKAEGRLTIKVPKSWSQASDLLLNGDTERHRTAMRCLLRSPDDDAFRDTEGRTRAPKVTVGKKWVTVDQRVMTWVVALGTREFGPWKLTVHPRLWNLELVRPSALDDSWWQEITVDLGGRAARSVSSSPTSGATTDLTWSTAKPGGAPPEVRVTLQPPAAKASAARWSNQPWFVVDALLWLLLQVVFLVLLLVVVRTVRRTPATTPRADSEVRTVRNLLSVGWLTFAISVVQLLASPALGYLAEQSTGPYWMRDQRIPLHFGLTVLTGLALCVFGRPGRTAGGLVAAATGYVTVVVCRPHWLALPSQLLLDWENFPDEAHHFQETHAMVAFAMACACVILIWLVGAVASLLRLWRALDAPVAGRPWGRFPHSLLAALIAGSTVVTTVSVWAAENLWEHQSWLSRRNGNDLYGLRHVTAVFNDLRWFPVDWLDWFYGGSLWWWCPSLAILALLRARAKATANPQAVVPTPADLCILKVFFIYSVGPVVGWYAGVPLPLLPMLALWLALTGLLALGTKRAILYRKLSSGHRLHELVKEPDRQHLLRAARQHRELHAQLRRLEQGQQDENRSKLERELDRLHRLPHPAPPSGLPRTWIRLPASISPVELALAWGPQGTSWDNAWRAARLTALFSVPAVVILTWANQVRGDQWGEKYFQRFGLAETVMHALEVELIWIGAGFTLGALWRVLPGRRGPVRAFGLALAYAAPVFVQWAGDWMVDQPINNWPLNLSLTLLVLTLTGVAMDIDTFRGERRYWPTRAGLLLSLYQWRTASVQVAFLVAQIVALVTIWQQLKGNEPMILIERSPNESGGGTEGNPP